MMPVTIKHGGIDGLSIAFGEFYCDTWVDAFKFITAVDLLYREAKKP